MRHDGSHAVYLLNRQAQEIVLRPSFETLISPELAQDVIPYEHQLNGIRSQSPESGGEPFP